MDNNNDVIDSNYVDPALLAQYSEEEKDYSREYIKTTTTPSFTPKENQTKLDTILEQAVAVEASDIHILVGCPPILRVSKELQYIEFVGEVSQEDMDTFIKEVVHDNPKVIELYEEQRLLDTNYQYGETRFRVNLSFSMDVPTMTMRLIKQDLPLYESLNLPPIIKKFTIASQGLILVTGKPGSGKSTTLNALVNEINENESKKILMLENPIEYVHKNKQSIIVQKEIGPFGDCKSYHEGVVNALREDCDVLIVGEIRDKITMDATIEMAETGHLVLGTLHTNSCAETIDRIINFYPTEDQQTVKFMVANALKLVVSQRMLRGGYNNLVMIPEVLVVDDHVGGMIKKDKFNSLEVEDAMQSGREKGNISIVFSLADAVNDGKITVEQAKREVDVKRHDLLLRVIAAGKQRRYL